jgi:LacI family transcriptional regulator
MAPPASSTPSRPSSRRRVSDTVTIRDVAARARVSVATVSRALNSTGPVRKETWNRVQRAVEALGFVPDAAARSLSIRRSHTIGVVLPELHGDFFSEVIRGVDLAARASGYHLLVSGSHSDAGEMSAVLRALRGRVDGLVVMAPDAEAQQVCMDMHPTVPVALLNPCDDARFLVTIDNYGGAVAMMRHLAGLGHQRIAFIKGPERNSDAAERRRAYRDVMHTIGPHARGTMEVDGDFTEASGYAAARQLMNVPERPTAIFAANDAMAIGALRALRQLDIHVPEQVALVGFDDIPMSQYLTPPLTTVNVPIAELGKRAFSLVLGAIDKKKPRRQQEALPGTLVIRESCGSHLQEKGAGINAQ